MGFFSDIPAWIQENVKLSHGGHGHSPQKGACVMEFVSLIAPSEKTMTDRPSCVNQAFIGFAQGINDSLSGKGLQKLLPYAHRFINTKHPTAEQQQTWIEAGAEWYNLKSQEYDLRATSAGPTLNAKNKTLQSITGACGELLTAILERHGKDVYDQEAMVLIHALFPNDRDEIFENLNWDGARALFTPSKRMQLFGTEVVPSGGGATPA